VLFDLNEDGKITGLEIKAHLATGGKGTPYEFEVKSVSLYAADKNKDGRQNPRQLSSGDAVSE